MNTTIAVTKEVSTLINILTVEPENQQKLIKLLRDNTEGVVSKLDGWISTSFIAAKDQRHVVIYSQWRDLASVEAMRANPDMVATSRGSQPSPRSTASQATSSTTTTPDARIKENEHAEPQWKTSGHHRRQPGGWGSRWSRRSLPAAPT
jgi:quinol monooxygenase YgiN